MPQAVVAVQAFIYGTVGTAAAAAGASSGLAASIATAAVTVATATAKVALLAGLNAVVANQNKPRPQGGLINLTINPSEPRRLQVGKRINGGVLSDWYVGGAKNGELFMIVYLGEGPMGQITKVYGGGREVYSTPLVHGTRTEIPAYRSVGDRIPGRLWITYYDGRPGQTADSYLVGKGLGWTTNHIGTGCAYAIIEAWWDSDNQTTPPSITFEMEGAKLYDRRKDTTAGGSGSHRANNPATWEVSSNPAVALDHYLLGRYTGSVKTFGVGLAASDVPYAEFAALANLCDEDVALKAGGTQKRYAASGFLFADRTYADTIRDLCRAMNARPADFGGRIGIIDGEEKTPVLTIEDGDVIESVPEAYTPKRSWADLVSVVRGTYQNPAQLYQAGEYPRITDAAWTAADGGSPKEATLDLEMETDVERAQRLATLFALRERRQAQLSGTYSLRTIELEQGDWFIRAGGIFGTSPGKTFEVIDRVLDPRSMTVTITAFEVDASDSAWDEADAIDPLPAPIPSTDELEPMEVPSLTVTGITLSGTAAQLPAIRVQWVEPTDTRVQQIVIEAVPAAGGVPTSAQVDWATGQVVFTSGITDDTDYLVRAKFVGDFIPSEWTTNYAVTTLGDYSVGAATTVPWSGVTGAGRPADNATVGARAGTNLFRTDGVTVLTQPEVRTVEGTAAAITGQGPGATAAAADVLNDALRTSSLFNVRLPDRPAVAADFTGSLSSGTPSSIAALATGTIVNVANEGDVRQFTDNTALAHRGWLPVVTGRTYRAQFRARVTVDGTGNQLFAQFVLFNAAGTVLASFGNTTVDASFVAADGWVNGEITGTGAAMLAAQATAAFVRVRVYGGRNSGNTHSGATWQAAYHRLEDATDPIRFATVETGANVTETRTAAAITGQGPGATAAAAAVLNAQAGIGANALTDTGFRQTTGYWSVAVGSGSGVFSAANRDGNLRAGIVTGSGMTVGTEIVLRNFGRGVPCRAGDVVGLRALVGASNASALVLAFRFRNAAGASLQFTQITVSGFGAGNAGASTFTEASGVATAPANTVVCEVELRAVASTAAPVARMALPTMAILPAGATVAPPLQVGFDAAAGADQTALNTAAAITGQGPGATATATDVLNTNIATRGLLSARPASGAFAGQLYYATDTGQQFDWTGAAWNLRADITAQSQLTIAATATTVTINCDSAGVLAAGQLPRTVGLTLKLGNTVVSADAAWSIVSAGAATATVDDTATIAAGNLTVTALPSNADIIVSATYGGVTLRITVSFHRLLAAPPVTGSGGGTSASDTSIVDPGSTSYTVVSDELTVTTGSGGQVRLVANVDYQQSALTNRFLSGRWQRNISGTWTDVGTEVNGTNSSTETDPESGSTFDTPGTLSIDQTITGLGASTSQSFRLRTKRSGGTVWSVYGSASATGS